MVRRERSTVGTANLRRTVIMWLLRWTIHRPADRGHQSHKTVLETLQNFESHSDKLDSGRFRDVCVAFFSAYENQLWCKFIGIDSYSNCDWLLYMSVNGLALLANQRCYRVQTFCPESEALATWDNNFHTGILVCNRTLGIGKAVVLNLRLPVRGGVSSVALELSCDSHEPACCVF